MSGECEKCGENCLDCKCPIIRERKWISKEEAKKMFPESVQPEQPLSFCADEGYETYKIDDNTIGVRPVWIKMSDRLPAYNQEILAWGPLLRSPYHMTFRKEFYNLWVEVIIGSMENITHWMPLPKPPEDHDGMDQCYRKDSKTR